MARARGLVAAAVGICLFGGVAALLAEDARSSSHEFACGQEIAQSTTLTHDLTDCPADGLVITQPGVTLDLGGHRVDGTGSGVGIAVDNLENVSIRNGIVREFTTGVRAFWSEAVNVSGVRVVRTADGIAVEGGNYPVVSSNEVGDNGRGIILADTWNATVSANRAWGNEIGIAVVSQADATVLSDNRSNRNDGTGIYVSESFTHLVRNLARHNRGHGIEIFDGSGEQEFTALYRLGANKATYNGGLGILVPPGTTDEGGNIAKNNGDPRECVNVSC